MSLLIEESICPCTAALSCVSPITAAITPVAESYVMLEPAVIAALANGLIAAESTVGIVGVPVKLA